VATFATELARLGLTSAAEAPPPPLARVWDEAVATDLPEILTRPPAALTSPVDGTDDSGTDNSGTDTIGMGNRGLDNRSLDRSDADVWILSQPFELLPGLTARAFIHRSADKSP